MSVRNTVPRTGSLRVRPAGTRPGRSRSPWARPCAALGLLGVLLASLVASTQAAGTPPPTESGGAPINPIRFVTDTGITVLVLEQHSLPIVQLHALVKAGSAQDPEDKAGLANLVALMLDEGTSTRSAGEIAETIDFVGGSLSTSVTADFTAVAVKVLAKDLALGFELLADVLLHPVFPADELSRVRSQVLGEIQSEQEDPELVARKAFRRLLFRQHPYRWPVNGTAETVAALTRADLRAFYQREYFPNQTILVAVGDVTVAGIKERIATHFGGWTSRAPSPRRYPPPDPIRTITIRGINRPLAQSTVVLGHLGISRSNPDYYAVSVMNYILGAGGFSSRLMDSIRDRQGLVYGIGSEFEANLMPGAFLVSLQTRHAAVNQAVDGALREIRALREEEVSETELAETKAYLIGSFPLRLDTTSDLARVLGLVELYGLGLEYFTSYPRWIDQVTREDVLRAARTYLHPDRYVLVHVGNLEEAALKLDGVQQKVPGDE